MKRILVVDDEPVARHTLHRGLTYKGFEVREAATGAETLNQLALNLPDLLLLDVMLPDRDGLALCRTIREQGYLVLPILLVTAKDEARDKIAGLDEGADDYITKPFDFEELVARIRAALRRVEEVPRLPEKMRVGDLFLDTRQRRVWRGARLIELTKKEYDLLEMLMQNAGLVLTKERIFERVWGYDNDCDTGWEIVKVYINYLRTKLNQGGMPNLIQTRRGVGYVLRSDACAIESAE